MLAELSYITDVLGIKSFFKDPHFVSAKIAPVDTVNFIGDKQAGLVFLTPSNANDTQIEMVKKMAGALKSQSFAFLQVEPSEVSSFIEAQEVSNQKIVIFSENSEEEGLSSYELGSVQYGEGKSLVVTHALNTLTDESHAYLQQLKKQTWQHLKDLHKA